MLACSDAAPPAGTPLVSPSPTAIPSTPSPTVPSAVPTLGIQPGGTGWLESAVAVADQPGERFLFTCPQAGFNGFLWGTDTYTTGSSVCTAAVHAGLITFDAGGQVVIEIRPGQESYVGSLRNGVTSDDYVQWDLSFVFPDAAPSSAPPPTSMPSGTPGIQPSPSTPAGDFSAELISPNTLVICSSFGRTRFAERDADGNPFGVDIEIGEGVADVLGVEAEFADVIFAELIDAVVDRQCDLTISGQFITQDRLTQIGMIPYREGAPHVIVPAGNPLQIDQATDLCGRRFGVIAATVYADMVRGTGDYVGEGINDRCLDGGAAAVDLREFPDQQQAEAALGAGDVDAYAGNEALAVENPDKFELTFELPRARNGIGHLLGAAALDAAVRDALRALIADGRYLAILEKYGAEDAALTITP